MTDSYFFGTDTSNYKTSVAVTDDKGRIVYEKSVLLDVEPGKRGLRQSECFYHHSMRLPVYIEEVFKAVDPSSIKAIGASSSPRRQEGSYMPCFNAGVNCSRTLAAALGIPVYTFSHQEGHAAAIVPVNETDKFIFMHLSGGTTEFLAAAPDNSGYDMHIMGGTKDISFGQLLDRFGVALGMPFPSGRFLDGIAYEALKEHDFDTGSFRTGILPAIKMKDHGFNLSGAETRLMNFSQSDDSKDQHKVSAVCAELFIKIALLLIRAAEELVSETGAGNVYIAGGVASSRSVREIIKMQAGPGSKSILFGDPALSGDNAVGIAKLTERSFNSK